MPGIDNITIEETIQDWLWCQRELTMLIPTSSIVTGELQDEDIDAPYAVITAAVEVLARTNSGRTDNAELNVVNVAKTFQSGRNWQQILIGQLDGIVDHTISGSQLSVESVTLQSFEYEQQENGQWLFSTVFETYYTITG